MSDPAIAKRAEIREYARRSGIRTFFETGTGDGSTLREMARDDTFDLLVSVELGEDNYLLNQRQFLLEPRVKLIHGDSDVVLPQMLDILYRPCVFWLDAHYCGSHRGQVDTPVLSELVHIFSRQRDNVILIDDARLFGRDPAYPTIEEIAALIVQYRAGYSVQVVRDIIRLTKPS